MINNENSWEYAEDSLFCISSVSVTADIFKIAIVLTEVILTAHLTKGNRSKPTQFASQNHTLSNSISKALIKNVTKCRGLVETCLHSSAVC